MITLIDIGNSSILIGFAEKDKIISTFRLKTFKEKTDDEYYLLLKPVLDQFPLTDVLISSVVPIVTSSFNKMFKKRYDINPMIMGQGLKTGIQLKVDDPKTVGADIVSDCAGIMNTYNEAIIIDLGTATKYIYVKNNVFYGVAISPGVAISMKALVSSAALLPNIELVCPKKVIGTNTIGSMQAGVVYGAASEVDGMISRILEEINQKDVPVIATGGLSSLIIPLCKNNIILDSELTLKGLLNIYYKNKE